MCVLYLNPIFKDMIWGGNKMASKYNYNIPSQTTGECWAISAHPNGETEISNGVYAGKKLSWLYDNHRELFGNIKYDRFPLLTKIIDAKENLSIQVHPDDEYAKKNENGSYGKMECWYILDCDEDASIIIGHNAKNKDELEHLVHESRWNELIREIPIKKGDFFQINPGCIHAIKGGTMILETQQNSDITYRVYDYGRLQNNKPRELHIDKSLDVISFENEKARNDNKSVSLKNKWLEQLVTCKYYTVWKGHVSGRQTINMDQSFFIGSVVEGYVNINNERAEAGTHFIIPSNEPSVDLDGEGELIISTAM